jgi:hypothetical protein
MIKDYKDYIGFDPVKWVERLIDVNDTSSFKGNEKKMINIHLNKLRNELELIQDDRNDN